MKKFLEPLSAATFCMTLSASRVTVGEFWLTSLHNVASVLLRFMALCSGLYRSCHSISHSRAEVWTFTVPLQHLDSCLLQQFSCRFAAVFGILILLHETVLVQAFSCWTDGLTFDSRILECIEEWCKVPGFPWL